MITLDQTKGPPCSVSCGAAGLKTGKEKGVQRRPGGHREFLEVVPPSISSLPLRWCWGRRAQQLGHRCFTLPGTSRHKQVSPGHQVPRCLWRTGGWKQLPAVLVRHRQTEALLCTGLVCAWTVCSSPTTTTMARCGPGGSAYINRRTAGRWLCMKQNAVALTGMSRKGV